MIDTPQLVRTFKDLCELASPAREEAVVAGHLRELFSAFGITLSDDGSAADVGSQCGNLLGAVEGENPDKWVMLCAHIDTVPHEGEIRVIEEDGVLRSYGKTILGADNKAAVAVLVELARGFVEEKPPLGVEFLFTVSEEIGLLGARAFDTSTLRSSFGYVFDHATDVGELIIKAPTHLRLIAEFIGRSAHAGIRPEDGCSAIVAAAKAVEAMKLGRIDSETTSNVGTVRGGTAANIVPENCRLVAEARSLDHTRAVALAQEMVDACTWGAGAIGADLKTTVSEEFHAYQLADNCPSVTVASSALLDIGVKPLLTSSGGGSDANAFIEQGFECLNIANGTKYNHTSEESVTVAALEQIGRLVPRLLVHCANA